MSKRCRWVAYLLPILLLYGCDPGAGLSLHEAASRGANRRLQSLLQAGAEVNEPGQNGLRPLHLAASNGYASTVELLIRAGASPDVRDDRGRTPLDLAMDRGHRTVSELLILAGAEIQANLETAPQAADSP